MKNFSDRLKDIRLKRRYTQLELAQRAGLSQSAVASYESGQRQSSRAIFKLATALGVEAQWLNTGAPPMRSTKKSAPSPAAPRALKKKSVNLSNNRASVTASGWPFPCIPHSHYDDLAPCYKQLLNKLIETFIDTCQTIEFVSSPSEPE